MLQVPSDKYWGAQTERYGYHPCWFYGFGCGVGTLEDALTQDLVLRSIQQVAGELQDQSASRPYAPASHQGLWYPQGGCRNGQHDLWTG